MIDRDVEEMMVSLKELTLERIKNFLLDNGRSLEVNVPILTSDEDDFWHVAHITKVFLNDQDQIKVHYEDSFMDFSSDDFLSELFTVGEILDTYDSLS